MNFNFSPRLQIIDSLQKILGKRPINLEIPEYEEFGDYTTNIAMVLFSEIKNPKTSPAGKKEEAKGWDLKASESPSKLAQKIVDMLKDDKGLTKIVTKIDVAGPGFINFWLSKDILIDNLIQIDVLKELYGKGDLLKGKKILLEHTSPNTIKTLHLGHVRNNVLGMAIHNILEFEGADVTLDAINNDRGIHVMKAVWAYIKYGDNKTPDQQKEKPDHFVDRFYQIGVKEEEKPQVKEEMRELLRRWEAGDREIRSVWKKLRDWTFEGFKKTYQRLGSCHDKQWFESDFYQKGKEMVELGLKKGVFKKLPDGAVISDLKNYGLTDTIILRADGTSMYHTQDLYLTKLKRETYPSDLYIWDIGPEQELYLKQLFAMCEQLGIGRREEYMHLSYGLVRLKGKGKMSSRLGNVVSADWLIDEVVAKARKILDSSQTGGKLKKWEKEKIAEAVGIGAIKYGFLKIARDTDLQFDIDESVSMEGSSGPYLQYTYARIQSVSRKAGISNYQFPISYKKLQLNNEEISLLRAFVHFPEVVETSSQNYAPNLICNYLYSLAQKFNAFYNKHKILVSEALIFEFRLRLTLAAGIILKSGLNLLGISAPEKM